MLNFLVISTSVQQSELCQSTTKNPLEQLKAYRNEQGQGFNQETLQAFADGLAGNFVCTRLDNEQ